MKNILTEKWISGGTWLMINCLVGVRGTIQGNSRQGNILGVCFTPSSTPHPSSPLPPLLQLNKDNCSLLAMLSVWLQNVFSHWLRWLGHRWGICSGADDGWGGTDPEDIALALCRLGLLCRDSAPFSVTFIGDCTRKAAVSSRILFFFFFRTTPPLYSAGLCAATWEISLHVKSWAALFLSEMRFEDSASTAAKKKRRRQSVCTFGLNSGPSCEGARWNRSIKEQRGSRFASQRCEKTDGISLPFAPPTLLRIWLHRRAQGVEIVHSSFLWGSYFG